MTARAIENGGGQPNDGGKPLDFSKDIVRQILDQIRDSSVHAGESNTSTNGRENRLPGTSSIEFTNCFPGLKDYIWKRAQGAPQGDDTSKPEQTVTMKNGDKITISVAGFTITDSNGRPVQKTLDPPQQAALDLPVVYKLTNGAEYRTRGTWNHDEFIRYPNGDYVHFTDDGKLKDSKVNGKVTKYA